MSMTGLFEKIRNHKLFSSHQAVWAFVVILLISIWVLNANPFRGETIGPFDLLLTQPGWATVEWDTVKNGEASDVLDSELPSWIKIKEQIRAGKGALWYPYSAGGKAMDIEPFNPAFLLFLAVEDNALAIYMVGLLKLVIAGFGGYLLLKTFLKWAPSMWGGIVFMLCGFNAAWFLVEQVTTAMWIPWLLAATVMYLKTNNMKWLPAITVSGALLIFGGFFSVAAFGLYAFGMLVLTWNAYDFSLDYMRASRKDNNRIKLYLKKSTLPMVAVSIAFLLAAVILIPFIDGLQGVNLSYRSGTVYGTGTVFGAGTNFKNGIMDLPLLFMYEYPLHIERTAFIGVPVGLFALFGIFRFFRSSDDNYRKFIFFHLLLVIITTLITFGLLPHDLIRALPIFSNNSWGRLVVVLLLGLSVLSAVGLDFVIAELPALLSRYVKITPLLVRGTVVIIVIIAAAFQFGSQKIFFNDSVAVVPSSWVYPVTPSIQYVKERLKPLQSVIADNSFMISGTLGSYGIGEWYGHALRSEKEKEVLGHMVMFPFASPTSAFIDAANILYNSYLIDKMAIKYVLVDKNFYQKSDRNLFGNKWNLIDLEKNIVVLENKNVTNGAYFVKNLEGLDDQPDFSAANVSFPSSDLINITYLKEGAGWIVLPMHLHRGWRAYIDDDEVKYDTYLDILPAIPVNGPGRIEFRYCPPAFRAGLIVSLTGLCILLAFSAICLKKRGRVT